MNSPSNESSSSDNEFWQSLEKSSPTKPVKKSNPAEPVQSSQLLISEKDRLLKTILNIRDSKEVELQNLQIKLENSSKKELLQKINEIKEEFVKEYTKLKKNNSESQTIIFQKDKKISQLLETLNTQENLITSLRIALATATKTTKPVKQEQNILNDELINLKNQLHLYKDITSELKSEIQTYQVLFKQLNSEIIHLKSIPDNTQEPNHVIEKLKHEKQELKQEFERYKQEVEKEVEIREFINSRHLQSINLLQEELKHTKNANISTVSNLKTFEKLKKNPEELNTQIKLDKPKAKSMPRYTTHGKIPSNYSYKEYKAFIPESCRNSNTPVRFLNKPPKLDLLPPKPTLLSISTDSRQKFFKSSVLFTSQN